MQFNGWWGSCTQNILKGKDLVVRVRRQVGLLLFEDGKGKNIAGEQRENKKIFEDFLTARTFFWQFTDSLWLQNFSLTKGIMLNQKESQTLPTITWGWMVNCSQALQFINYNGGNAIEYQGIQSAWHCSSHQKNFCNKQTLLIRAFNEPERDKVKYLSEWNWNGFLIISIPKKNWAQAS